MSELMRFRLIRAPQKQFIVNGAYVSIEVDFFHFQEHNSSPYSPIQILLPDLLADSTPYVIGFTKNEITVLGKPAQLVTKIADLERWLTKKQNSCSGEELGSELHHLCQVINPGDLPAEYHAGELGVYAKLLMKLEGASADGFPGPPDSLWYQDRLNAGFSLMVAMLRDVEPSRAIYLNRLMLVFGLVELATQEPNRLKKPEDINWALRSRIAILPEKFVEHLRSQRPVSSLARRPGLADLYIVRSEWVRYEAGEIAHIENVMASETRERNHTTTTETEETTTTSEQRNSLNEQDSQTTDRFNLHNEASQDSSLNIKADASVDVSAQYGTAKINSHLGGSLDYSLNESQRKATDVAHESVSRSVTRVEEQVTKARSLRSLTRIVEENKHSFENNAEGATHISGIYRWVNKIEHVQIFRYPNRFLMEFQVPEPGAWLRWLLAQKTPKTVSEEPIPLTIDGKLGSEALTFKNIGKDNYANFASRYKTLGILPPPEDKNIALAITKASPPDPKDDKEPIQYQVNKSLTIPDGYKATKWKASIQSWHNYHIDWFQGADGKGDTNESGVTVFLAVGSQEESKRGFNDPGEDKQQAKYKALNTTATGDVGDICAEQYP